MRAFVLACMLAAACASPLVSTHYQIQDALGGYSFGHAGGPTARQELRTHAGVVEGSYSYIDPHGLVQHSAYVADPFHGFRVAATDLPVAVYPSHGYIQDTPEVAHAKLEHAAAHAAARARGKRAAAYHGPPAPLNRDGTVAYTPEIQQANAVHTAAYQQEFQRLQAAAQLAAAHPDRTSPPSQDYNPANNGQYSGQQYDNGQYNPQWNNPAYNQGPAQYNPTQYTQPQYNQPQYNPPQYNQQPSYNNYQQQPPAPLNPDGTAAQTQEYRSIAASHQQAFHQALARAKRSVALNPDGTVAPTPEVAAATAAHLAAVHGTRQWAAAPAGYAHWSAPAHYAHVYAHAAAPLNHDGTVAPTAEVAHATAAHAAYYAKQLSDLAHQEAFAVSAGPGEGDYDHYSGHYGDHYGTHYAAHYVSPVSYSAHYGAPLNHDGTVAPTPEVAAATAAHLAAHAQARTGHLY